jgi:hypothetical protein
MAFENVISSWVLTHRKELNLRVTVLRWPQTLDLELHDLHVQITWEGHIYLGRGSGSSQEEAFDKAVTEAMERTMLRSLGVKTSNGVACHLDQKLAEDSAKAELIERDLFLCHFFTQTPFRPFFEKKLRSIFLDFSIELPIFNKSKKYFSRKNIPLVIYDCGFSDHLHTVLVCAFGKNYKNPFGFVFGSACKKNLKQAIESATIECLRHLVSVIQEPSLETLSEEKFLEKSSWDFHDHGSLGLNLSYFKKIEHLFPLSITGREGEEDPTEELVLSSSLKQIYSISYTQSCIPKTPFFITKAQSPQLQELFLGPSNSNQWNISRLKEFSQKSEETFLCIPHPFN